MRTAENDLCVFRAFVIGEHLTDQGVQQDRLASELFYRLLREHGIDRSDVGRIVATGGADLANEIEESGYEAYRSASGAATG